jgi:hypothetical protein
MASQEVRRSFTDKAYFAQVNDCKFLDPQTGQCTYSGALNPGGRVRRTECLPYSTKATLTFYDVTVTYQDNSLQRGFAIGNIWATLNPTPTSIIKEHLCDCYEYQPPSRE